MWVKKIDHLESAKRRRQGRRLWLITAIVKRSSSAPKAVKAWVICRRRVKRMTDNEALRIQRLNAQLFERNQSIVQENERLKKQALLLSEENQILQCKLQEKLRCPDRSLES